MPTGRLLYTTTPARPAADLTHLPAGLYRLHFRTPTATFSKTYFLQSN